MRLSVPRSQVKDTDHYSPHYVEVGEDGLHRKADVRAGEAGEDSIDLAMSKPSRTEDGIDGVRNSASFATSSLRVLEPGPPAYVPNASLSSLRKLLCITSSQKLNSPSLH